jgi:hypothetical protein
MMMEQKNIFLKTCLKLKEDKVKWVWEMILNLYRSFRVI